MTYFLTVSEVEEALQDSGAQFTRVTFMKKNGDVESRVGRPKTFSRRVNPETATPEQIERARIATESLRNNGNVFLDYPTQAEIERRGKPGFAFSKARVLGIGDVGEHSDQ